MGLFAGKPDHPRRRSAQTWLAGQTCAWTLIAGFLTPAFAETIRIATFNASLSRGAPGALLRDIEKGHKQVAAIITILQKIRPDIVLINELDYDPDLRALTAFVSALNTGNAPLDYPHSFAAPPNTGYLSGFDLNNDGKTAGPGDAWGYGRYPGHYGMALLSRYPIKEEAVRTFAHLRWVDLPGTTLPTHPDGSAYPTAEARAAMRLSSKSHWDVPVLINGKPLHVLASHPTPPVFDGPEDRNGLRNGDEIRFWSLYLSGTPLADDQGGRAGANDAPAVVLGDLNLDPADGDGVKSAIRELLAHPRLQDPAPQGPGGAAAQGGINPSHHGNPALDTADWNDKAPGNLRVDYVLPDAQLRVIDSGVFWPAPGDPDVALTKGRASSDHRLVWVDIDWP